VEAARAIVRIVGSTAGINRETRDHRPANESKTIRQLEALIEINYGKD
jgi:hypothetical protein